MFEERDLIDGSSRADLIADGTLIDVTDSAVAHGITLHTCIHETLYGDLFGFSSEEKVKKDLEKFMKAVVKKLDKAQEEIRIPMLYANCAFILHVGPGDDEKLVLTILYSRDV